MSNILVVESTNDRIFIETLIEVINENLEKKIKIDDYRPLNGSDPRKIEIALENLKEEAGTESIGIPKIGIILDIDTFSINERLNLLNQSINKVFNISTAQLNLQEFIEVRNNYEDKLEITSFFMNVNGKGELATVLREIKNQEQESIYADCIESWKSCIYTSVQNPNKIIISDNDFDKLWVYNYIYYDISKKEYTFNKDGFKHIMNNKRDIWNFNHPILKDLKMFLTLFETET